VDRVIRAVLLDAMGTLVHLRDPAPALAARLGIGEDEARAGFAREVAYYRAHHLEGRDEASLLDLRLRCVEALGVEGATLDDLLGSIAFEAAPGAAAVPRDLRAAGLRTVAVSNWDVSLPEALARAGLAELLDGIVSSAAVGAAKPDPRPFLRALELAAGKELDLTPLCPQDVVHVGDSEREDGDGARAAGIRPLILGRDLGSLGELSQLLKTAP
jgi:putative hydrolase of the HAD superfamily